MTTERVIKEFIRVITLRKLELERGIACPFRKKSVEENIIKLEKRMAEFIKTGVL